MREVVDIDKMQYGFMPGKGTVFVLRRLREKFRAKNKKLFFIFVDLEKAFDRVPREVVHFDLRWKGVPEYLVKGLCLCIKVVKLLSQLMGNYQAHFQ